MGNNSRPNNTIFIYGLHKFSECLPDFFSSVNVQTILRDISDKLNILKKHLNAHSGFTYSYYIPILQFTIEGPN